MNGFAKSLAGSRLAPSIALVAVMLLAAWMGDVSGGYFVAEWGPVAFALGAVVIAGSVSGIFSPPWPAWSTLALGLFGAYAAWTFASLLWAPNKGDAWLGAGQTLLYLLAFWIALSLIPLGASRRWAIAASVLGPAVLAALTLRALPGRFEDLFPYGRLLGTVGYSNGEAAFLLVPFWPAIYLAGSPKANFAVRSLALAGAVVCLSTALLTQSRGAAAALILSLPVYFLFSGQRLRGLISLAPIAVALFTVFPNLNAVYVEYLQENDPAPVLVGALPEVWLAALGAGFYGLLWSLADRAWRPPEGLTRAAGIAVLAVCATLLTIGAFVFVQRAGSPADFAQSRWEAFKTDDPAGQEQSRYLSASGSGRYTMWEAAGRAFRQSPVLGTGTQNFEAAYYQLRDAPSISARQPHMLPLEVLTERGVIGGALFFGFLAACASAGLRQRFGRLNTEGKAQIGALAAGVAYWFIHAGAEWFWQLPAITMPAIIYLAMLAAPWNRSRDTPPSPWPLRLSAAIIGIVAMTAIAPLYISDLYLRQSHEVSDTGQALGYVERAQTFNPVNPRLHNREAELAIQAGDWDRVERAYGEAIRLNSRHYESYMFRAAFHERRGETEEALTYYREALQRNSQDPDLRQKADQLEED